MPGKRLTKTDRIIHAFGREIAHGLHAPGSALPSESELCAKYETSRNVLREVVKVLATKRLIDAQRYRGLFVMPREQWNFLDADVLEWVLEKADDPLLLQSLVEVRGLIEPTISRWAAERASAADLAAIERALDDMRNTVADRAAFMEADIRFHHAVVQASHNLVILQLSDAISALQRAIFDRTYLPAADHLALTLREHGALLEMIRCRDPQGAEALASEMIARTASRAH